MSAFNNIMAPTSGPAPEYLHLKILPPFTAMFNVQVQFGRGLAAQSWDLRCSHGELARPSVGPFVIMLSCVGCVN